ncbi:MAG TPA: OB-fold domain-containing protein [Candidatus Binatia bacterium]|nr:OB-fold domain-containing protein [Candidatus Binatia bacterium]
MSGTPTRPLPNTSARMAPFWSAAKQGVLVIQRCRRCGQHRFPAAELCSNCLASELAWVEASGRGELFSFVVVHHALDPYFAERAPYLVADVKLTEGPHMTTTLIECPPSRARIGDAATVRFEKVNDDFFLPVFRRA